MSTQSKNYIFVDESGKPEVYSARGINLVERGFATKFLVLAAVRCDDQLLLQQQITDFRAGLLRDKNLAKIFSPAYSLEGFHAQTDYPEVKERFFCFINNLDVKIDVMVVEKLKCFDALKRDPSKMYGIMAGQLLKNICHQAERTEIIFSRKDSKLKLRKELECKVEEIRLDYLTEHPNLKSEMFVNYRHNPHYTHGGLQAADYIAYAIFQIYENKNNEWYAIIRDRVGKIQDICNKKYFTQSNPLQLST